MTPSEFNYVGFWPRVGAAIIDSIVFVPILGVLLWMVYGSAYFSEANTDHVAGPLELIILYVLPAVVTVALWLKLHATPGKMVIQAEVVDAASGNPMRTG
jgi:uncharacterized RDD family membrane protein YckC